MEPSHARSPQPMQTRFAPAAPLYRQVENYLRGEIEAGNLVAGDLIPSETQLAETLGVSQGTVKKALDNLVHERLLYRHQGKGTYVSRIDFNNSLFRFFSYGGGSGEAIRIHKETPSRHVGPGPDEACDRLQVERGTSLLYIERVGYEESDPILIERCWWIAEFVGGLEDEAVRIPDLMYALVEERFNLPIVRASETLTARAADREDATLLSIEPGAPLVCLHRLAYTTGGRPIEYRMTHGRADRFSYKTEIR